MTRLVEFEEFATDEIRRESLYLVSRMLRYRVDTMAGLQEDLHEALEGVRDRGNQRRFRRNAKRLARLLDRIEQLAGDNQYDAMHLAAILRVRRPVTGDRPSPAPDDQIVYIA